MKTEQLIQLLKEFDATGKREVHLTMEGQDGAYGICHRISLTTSTTTDSTRIVLYAKPPVNRVRKRTRVVSVKANTQTKPTAPTFPPHAAVAELPEVQPAKDVSPTLSVND